ncbi:hypothetical protein QQX09_04715 [Demequina sp. SYSU T00192]|uniref:DUF222 domain-containing protein n=1 Tax=Demequina litoralis TaxID=3051660 RepID=A0ABT8G7P7_9MICO|nr:hypothetical protein [Demequina sp. SYSU T00192]MDN4475160.1 hypothetical protein [Demequina sp. SYSU T00192]
MKGGPRALAARVLRGVPGIRAAIPDPSARTGAHHREESSRWWDALAEASATAAEHTYSRSLQSRRLLRSVNALAGALALRAGREGVAAGTEPLVRSGASKEKRAALDLARDARVAGETDLAILVAGEVTRTDPGSRVAWSYLAAALHADGLLTEAAVARGHDDPDAGARVATALAALDGAVGAAAPDLDLPPAPPRPEATVVRAAQAIETRTLLGLPGACDALDVARAHRELAVAEQELRWSDADVLALEVMEIAELRDHLAGRAIHAVLDGAEPPVPAPDGAARALVVFDDRRFEPSDGVDGAAPVIRVTGATARSGWDTPADARWVVSANDDEWHAAIAESVVPGAQPRLVGVGLRAPLAVALHGRTDGSVAYAVIRALDALRLGESLTVTLPADEATVPADLAEWLHEAGTTKDRTVRLERNR